MYTIPLTLWYRNASRRRQPTKPLRFNSCSFVLVVLVSAHEGTEIVEFPVTRVHRAAGGGERACNFLYSTRIDGIVLRVAKNTVSG